ncbi:MAG: histidine--tRNA ligase [Planctomycetes bacterium]|nr:histidine--tRNA ligase [Planctomycetota bacterium]
MSSTAGNAPLPETSELNVEVRPQTLRGFQDLLPPDMLARDWVVARIKKVYERYGFQPLDTPVLESLAALVGTGGEETNKQLFRLKTPEGEPIAMRFDLTVPFARLIAQYPEQLKLPFRRYHIGPVFRADDPAPGRFRQFTQLDIDAAGSSSVAVDAEMIAAMCEVLREIGLNNANVAAGRPQEFLVKINNRKLVDALLEGCGIGELERHKHVLRVVDKLDKVGLDEVRKELGEGRIDTSGDRIRGVGLSADVIDQIIAFVEIHEATREATLETLAARLPKSDASSAALAEMRELATCLDALAVSQRDAVFDPSLARGLDYYTGPVYEAILPAAKVGSVMGGGRYDGLIARFSEEPVPAAGVSVGLDRLIAGLQAAGKLQPADSSVQVLIVTMPGVPQPETLRLAAQLRQAEISTVAYFGQGKPRPRDQFSYANRYEIPVAVILGEDEVKRNVVSVKNLRLGEWLRRNITDNEEYRMRAREAQVEVSRDQLIETVRKMLAWTPEQEQAGQEAK